MLDVITTVVERLGAFGVALLMFAENVFPPIPSELVMPLAGYAAARGDATLAGVIAGGVVGSLAGAWVWYEAGRRLGASRLRRLAARHGRWLTVSPADVDRANAWFARHGAAAVLLGRLVPAVRTLVSVPAGIARMGRGRFLLFSLAGTAVWTSALALAGAALGSGFGAVERWLGPVSNIVVAALVLAYVWRVATHRGEDGGEDGANDGR